MKQKYLLLSMIVLIFLFSATSLSVLAVTPNLELTPSTQSVTMGNQANINVEVAEVTDLRGANITLNFDASKLQYISSADGGFIPSATLLEQSIDNTNGSVTLDIAGFGTSAYASGSGTIMTVVFERIATGSANITFGVTTLRDKDNINITHTKGNGCCITSLIGDFNGDGCVEFEDLMIFAMAYGSCEGDVNWNPDCDLNGDGCVEFEDLMLFAMNYGKYEYTLATSVTPAGSGYITLNPSGGTYAPGTVVTITAHPYSGCNFDHWSGDASGTSNPVTVTMNSNKSVTANFDCGGDFTLIASVSPPGSGYVIFLPSGGTYPAGTDVMVTAYPNDGWLFDHWGGDVSGTSNTMVITMNGNKSVTAYFVPIQYILTTSVIPSDAGYFTLSPSAVPMQPGL